METRNGEQFTGSGEREKVNTERNYAYIDIWVDFSVNDKKIIESSQDCVG